MKIAEIRHQPGRKFIEPALGGRFMVLRLCAGMIRAGSQMDSSGGLHSVAVVNLVTGSAWFMEDSTEIVPLPDD